MIQIAIASNFALAHACEILACGTDPHSGNEGFLIPAHAPGGNANAQSGEPLRWTPLQRLL